MEEITCLTALVRKPFKATTTAFPVPKPNPLPKTLLKTASHQLFDQTLYNNYDKKGKLSSKRLPNKKAV